jgi:hypothetical protein
MNKPELDGLFVDFGGFVDLRQEVNIVHNQPLNLPTTLDLAQINKLAHHNNHQVRIGDILMGFGLDSIDELLKLGEVVGD